MTKERPSMKKTYLINLAYALLVTAGTALSPQTTAAGPTPKSSINTTIYKPTIQTGIPTVGSMGTRKSVVAPGSMGTGKIQKAAPGSMGTG
jgi:hypothetical protein